MADFQQTPLLNLPVPRGPLIKVARVKWERDPAITDLIEYFDEPRFHDSRIKNDQQRFELLTVKELRVIQDIAQKCREDFTYAAKNFFWITTKKRVDKLFSLWESQQLIYEHLIGLKAKGLPMKMQILKARQLGSSTIVEGLIAWRSCFFRNTNAIVVSYDPGHAAYLFGIMQHVYDMLVWWLKPQCSSREYKDGLRFDNPDYEDRRNNPGLNSQVTVQAANKRTGVGTGTRINAAHLSEYSLWNQDYAVDVIEKDLGNALAEDDPDMFAILESTAQGTGNYSYRLWRKNVELAEQAEWSPLFLPWFFESSRVLAPPKGWRLEEPEVVMQDRVAKDWLRCNNEECLQYHERYRRTEDLEGSTCVTCRTGVLEPYQLSREQLYWMQRKRKNAEKDSESLKTLKQEQCCIVGESKIYSIVEGIIPISMAISTKRVDTGDVAEWSSHGVKPVGELKTKRNRRIKCTYDHKFALTDGRWVQAWDLRPGDKLVLAPPKFTNEYCTVKWETTPYHKNSLTVDAMFGRFLGYFMGDGCWTGGGVTIACDSKDEDVIDDVKRVLRAVSGHDTLSYKKGKMETVACNSSKWLEILQALGVLKEVGRENRDSDEYHKKTGGYRRKVCVPECIWKSPKSVVRQFLSALFECDGHGYRDTPKTTLFTCWEEFSHDIQLLLLGFGINAVVRSEDKHKKRPDGTWRTYEGRTVSCTLEGSNLFHEEIGFVGNRKRTTACVRAESGHTARRGFFRNEMAEEYHSFTLCGEAPVFDLTVPGANSFGANGFLVHNSTAIEAFQVSGIQVFSEAAQEFANSGIIPPIKEGFLDKSGKFHGCNPKDIKRNPHTNEYYEGCYIEGCTADHEYGDNHGEKPLRVWKEPEEGGVYVIGADVAEGLGGDADFSVGSILKISTNGGIDEQVAVWRSNRNDPIAFAHVLNYLGRWYNEAMMSIEVNRYDTTMSTIRFNLQYPNLYRWKHLDSLQILSNKLGWFTQSNSKPRLYQTFHRALLQKILIIRSENLAEEMKTFVKEDFQEKGAGSETGSFDDEIMATMIALYCAHEGDWDESMDQINFNKRQLTIEEAPWIMQCFGCQLVWPAHSNKDDRQCPRCKSMQIGGRAQSGGDKQSRVFGDDNRLIGADIGDDLMQTRDWASVQEYHVSTSPSEHSEPEPEYESL